MSAAPLASLNASHLVRNMGWNLLGQIAPILAALVSIPLLLQKIGNERFGLLAIGWMLIGYFSIFDLGLGRALTQSIASRRAQTPDAPVADIIWSGLALMLGLGLLAGLILCLGADYMVTSLLKIAPSLQAEAKQSILLLVPAMPLVVLATGLRGVLEALQAFKLVNLVRTPVGVLTFVAPLLALPFSISLVPIFAMLSGLRLLTLLFFMLACRRALPELSQGRILSRISCQHLPELLRFGGWMTVSNLIGPLMVNMDRLVIGSVLSLTAVSFYSTPHEMVMRALVVPGAIAGVCFPVFAATDRLSAQRVFWKSTQAVAICMVLLLLLVLPWADSLLQWWLSAEFARNSAPVLRWLALGVALNGLAHIPFAYVQGIGQSKVTAQFHLFELAVYAPLLYVCIHWQGIVGVAIAWTVRAALDAVCLFYYAMQKMRESHGSVV